MVHGSFISFHFFHDSFCRLAGATLLAPVINYWWPGFPAELAKKGYEKQLMQDQWTLRVAHHLPWLTYWWNSQKWFPASSVTARHPASFSPADIEIISKLSRREKYAVLYISFLYLLVQVQ